MQATPSPNRLRLLFAALYLGEGAPIGFIWWALPTWLRVQGVPVEQITALTSVLVLPWVGKFLWAPLIDRIRGPRYGLHAVIVAAQAAMGLTLVPLTSLSMATQFDVVRILLVVHAFAAATQDVAVDALALRLVPSADRGRLNGGMQAGMLLGRSAFGGGALVIAATAGWTIVLWGLVACIWISTVAVWFSPPARLQPHRPCEPRSAGSSGTAGLARPAILLGFAFALIGGAGFEGAGVLCGPMLVDRGVSQETVGWLLGVPVVVSTVVGGLAGGVLADRWGGARTVTVGIAGFSVLAALVGWLGVAADVPTLWLFTTLTALYFCIGVFIAASYALFMALSEPPWAATKFSAFMATTNGCEAWAGWAGGRLVARFDYAVAFTALSLVSLAVIPLVGRLGKANTERA